MNGDKTIEITMSRVQQLDGCLCDGCRDNFRKLLDVWKAVDAKEEQRTRAYLEGLQARHEEEQNMKDAL